MTACETMCDVCTQRELVAVNLQNLKVEFDGIRHSKFDSVFFRKRKSMMSIIDVQIIGYYIEMKVVKNSMKVVELLIDVMNVNIEKPMMNIVVMMKLNQQN